MLKGEESISSISSDQTFQGAADVATMSKDTLGQDFGRLQFTEQVQGLNEEGKDESSSMSSFGIHQAHIGVDEFLAKVGPAVKSKAIRFLSGKWLVKQKTIHRMQELPEEAFLKSARALKLCAQLFPSHFIAVSYPWLDSAHPDPLGFHLSNLKPFLELFLQTDVTEGDAAVFWDFACLPQHPRTEREQVFFQTGLHLVDTLYGFAAATVVQLKRLPPGFQGRPYRERGWCCFEEHVACLTKENNLLLDLSLFPQNVPLELERWEQKQKRLNPNMSVLDVCEPLEQRLFCIKDICMGGSHPPPTHPDELDEKLSRLSFTNKADSLTVSKIYRDLFFLTAAQTPDFLDLGCPLASGWQGWGLGEITSLARALPCFTRLQGLHLPGHPIGDEGLAVLCGALGEMPQLEDLELHDCVFGEEAFARAAPTLLKMKELMIPEWLQDTAAGKAFSRQWREAKNDPTLLEFYSNDIDSTSH